MSASTSIKLIGTYRHPRRRETLDLAALEGLKHGWPRWFRRIVEKDCHNSFWRDWMDHSATDGTALVTEPYRLDRKDLKEMLEFAERYGLDISFSGISSHFPSRTLNVTLWPRDPKEAAA